MDEALGKRVLGACAVVALVLLLASLLPDPDSLPPPAAKRVIYDLREPQVQATPEQVQGLLDSIDPAAVVAKALPPGHDSTAATVDVPLDDPRLASQRAKRPPPQRQPPVAVKPRPVAPPPVAVQTPAAPRAQPATPVLPTQPEPAPQAAGPSPSTPEQQVAAAGGGGWYVQVGVFASEANANKAAKRLQDAGQPVRADRFKSQAGIRHRVRCGPFSSAAEAQSARSAVAALGFTDARMSEEAR
jgi:cell division septation protein DedD